MVLSPPVALRPARRLAAMGRRAVTWPTSSQQVSRRNAMLAASDLRHLRNQQREVEEYLATVRPRRRAATG